MLTPQHIEAWERTHGRIEAGSWVLMRTDWSKRRDAAAFLNIKEDGSHVPGPHPNLSSISWPRSATSSAGAPKESAPTPARLSVSTRRFPCHSIMHGSNKFGLASLTNLDQLPPKGAILITPPLKIVNGSGSPCRVLALVGA